VPSLVKMTIEGEAREVALAEAQAVLAHGGEKYATLVAAVDAGEVEGDDEQLLESVLELGLQTGRIRAYYGPGGEQAALATLRKLPRGRERTDSAREVSKALQTLVGKSLEGVSIAALAPGVFTVSLNADGFETSVRLDASGVRLASVAT
jgi:hypothetical protein